MVEPVNGSTKTWTLPWPVILCCLSPVNLALMLIDATGCPIMFAGAVVRCYLGNACFTESKQNICELIQGSTTYREPCRCSTSFQEACAYEGMHLRPQILFAVFHAFSRGVEDSRPNSYVSGSWGVRC